MKRYVSILRGINVGGHKKVLMSDLKNLFKGLGLENIVTYIQSGNVVFDTECDQPQDLKQIIETMIEEYYGFKVPVIIRSHDELQKVVVQDPFEEIDKIENGSKLHVFFLSEPPLQEAVKSLMACIKGLEQFVVKDNHLYIWYPNGAGRSKLTTQVIEKKLGVQATARNWKTTTKLLELSQPL